MERPAGVTAIAALFLAASAYLAGTGTIMLAAPGLAPMRLGAPLLFGLELAGPYMFLLAGAGGGIVGWGLLRLNRWARRGALLVLLAGLLMLVPEVSAAVVGQQLGALAAGAAGFIVRMAAVWYLYQERIAATFLQRGARAVAE